MIQFQCNNCGRRFKVPDQKAGKKGKCPKCKNVIIVPLEASAPAEFVSAKSDAGKTEPPSPFNDPLLQQNPRLEHIAESQPDPTQGQQFQTPQESEGMSLLEPASPPRRRFPWLIDIFLYPTSKAGLTTVGIIIGVPLLLKGIAFVLGLISMAFPPFIVLLAVVVIGGIFIKVIIGLYLLWYFCECIRDSAVGGLRAPETVGTTPGMGELLWLLLRLICCYAIFFGPAIYYRVSIKYSGAEVNNLIFWSLVTYGVFFFPMGILAVVMFDSIRGLNPVLIIRSIISTFFQYLGVVVLFYGLGLLFIAGIAGLRIFGITVGPVLSSVLIFILNFIGFIWLLLVSGHLLGRFYYRYQDKLYWEV